MTYPILLAHGVCRFDILWAEHLNADNNDDPTIDRFHYFRGLRTMLMGLGYEVYHSGVGWATGVENRARDLRENISRILNQSGAEKIHIIAHSMGGLDARHMLFNDRNREKIHHHIASLSTISTPHRGSPFADWGLDHLEKVPSLLKKIGLDVSAFRDLRTDACKAFDQDPEVRGFEKHCEKHIKFQTYAGRQNFPGIFTPLKASARIIEGREGPNDGLVSVESAKWREAYFKGILDRTDHLNELGWWDLDQILEGENSEALLKRIHRFYADIAKDLS